VLLIQVNLFELEHQILVMWIELHLVGMETYIVDMPADQLQLVPLVNIVDNHLGLLLIFQLL
jgi:hypothetical protein